MRTTFHRGPQPTMLRPNPEAVSGTKSTHHPNGSSLSALAVLGQFEQFPTVGERLALTVTIRPVRC
jgi:hypothetical protein